MFISFINELQFNGRFESAPDMKATCFTKIIRKQKFDFFLMTLQKYFS